MDAKDLALRILKQIKENGEFTSGWLTPQSMSTFEVNAVTLIDYIASTGVVSGEEAKAFFDSDGDENEES